MKVFKVLAVIFVALIFLLGLTLIAMSADKISNIQTGQTHQTVPITEKPQPIPANACPAGWHVTSNSASGWTCRHDDPTNGVECNNNRGVIYFYGNVDNVCKLGCKMIPNAQPINPCPAGWHLTIPAYLVNGKSVFTCSPISPNPIACPNGYKYYNNGCEVGCEEITSTTLTPAQPVNPNCPAGWHVTSNSASGWICRHDDPTNGVECNNNRGVIYFYGNVDNVCKLGCKLISNAQPINPCPAGWHLTSGSANGSLVFTCSPISPNPIACPKGYKYYNNGCDVGCKKMM